VDPKFVRANDPTIESRSPAMTTRGWVNYFGGSTTETKCPDPPASLFPRIDLSPFRVATRVPCPVAVPLSRPAPILTKNCTHGTAETSQARRSPCPARTKIHFPRFLISIEPNVLRPCKQLAKLFGRPADAGLRKDHKRCQERDAALFSLGRRFARAAARS
jgi:hypothetical protein